MFMMNMSSRTRKIIDMVQSQSVSSWRRLCNIPLNNSIQNELVEESHENNVGPVNNRYQGDNSPDSNPQEIKRHGAFGEDHIQNDSNLRIISDIVIKKTSFEHNHNGSFGSDPEKANISNGSSVISDSVNIPSFSMDSPESPVYDSDKDPPYSPDSSDSKGGSDEDMDGNTNKSYISMKNLSPLNDIQDSFNKDLHLSVMENTESERNCGENTLTQTDQSIIPQTIIHHASSPNKNTFPTNGSVTTKISKRVKDMCFFCEEDVLNFARHIRRQHSMEIEVQEIFSKPVGSHERKNLITKLRKKGNFLKCETKCMKPVRKPLSDSTNFLPCDNCLGLYASKQLYRHRKKCLGRCEGRQNAQSCGQNRLLNNIRIDQKLKEIVFPRMRADKISLVAKKDSLICAFGARYLKTHREKHFVNVTSRKMRDLARILIEVKKLEPCIRNMFEALQPKYFDLFISATKTVAKFNSDTETFQSPTYAMNISTSLKNCCDIAMNYALKKKEYYSDLETAEAKSDLKIMIHLFESNWKYEISSQAGQDLNLQKWNKVTIIPLASDLKLLREYLISTANKAIAKLNENNNDTKAFIILLETIFCRVILFNRKRPGELQRMFLHTYLQRTEEKQSYEEFNNIVSPTEKILLKTLKRVVIRGKWGRGVPVLFSADVQKHIDIILEHRNKHVPSQNPYLFGKKDTKSTLYGYKVLQKYTSNCGAKNPQAITATRLRKHLATLSQIYNMNEIELEQLATFMGHTMNVHKNSYRLPNDVFQTAKISKILLSMENGEASQFQGKTLDEVEVDLEENLLSQSEECSNPIERTYEQEFNDELPVCQSNIHSNVDATVQIEQKVKNKKKRVLTKWSEEQKKVVKDFFQGHIKKRKPPKRFECEELIEKHSTLLKDKNWLKIKVFIQNIYTKKY